MRITSIELFHVSVPLRKTFWPSWIPGYPQTHNRFTLAKLVTDDGIEGYAAGQSMGKERQGLGDLLGSYLLGTDPTDIDRVQDLLKQAGFLGWRNFWLEAACWDIKGKAAGKPAYELLGGTPRPLPVYLSTGEVHPPEQRVDELLAMMERGYRTAKLRVKSPSLAEDIRQIEIVRKGVGDDLALGVDANQGWLVSIVDRVPAWDLKRATEFAAACHDNGFSWLEEPLDWHDYDGLAALKKVSKVKIAGAELNHGWDEIKIMFEKDCFDIYQPDACFAGGMAQVKKVIDACHEHDRHLLAAHLDQRHRLLRELEHGAGRPQEQPPARVPARRAVVDSRVPRRHHRPNPPQQERHAPPVPPPGPRLRDQQEATPQIRQTLLQTHRNRPEAKGHPRKGPQGRARHQEAQRPNGSVGTVPFFTVAERHVHTN